MLKGFKEFILRGNVVDLAVAVVIGAAFGAVVTAFVADIITPIVAAIAGKPDFSALTFTIHHSKFQYGAFINAVVSFLIIAAAIYFVVVFPLNKLAERRAARLATGQPDPDPKSEDILLLEQIRDLLASQQGGAAAVSAITPTPGPTSS
jgi:large conductance mechanosensitive channel